MDKLTTPARPALASTTREQWATRMATDRSQALSSKDVTKAMPEGQATPDRQRVSSVSSVHPRGVFGETQAPPEPARRPGRPAKGTRALTAAERQAQSRRRRREAAVSVTDDLRAADDAALLAGLALRLKDTQTQGEWGDTARWVAGRILGELCRRHRIEPQGFVTVTKGDGA